jgi:hypothetical protein
MKSSTSTFIEWGAVLLVAFFAVPRLLGALSGSNAKQSTQYSPGAAANAQAARAINTAGLVGNSALGDFLARLLNPSKPPTASSQSPGAKGGNTATQAASGGGATRPSGSPDMSWFGGIFNGGSVNGVSDPALGSIAYMPTVFDPDSVLMPTYDELYGVYQDAASGGGDASVSAADFIAGFGADSYADNAYFDSGYSDPWSYDFLASAPDPAPVRLPGDVSDFELFGFGDGYEQSGGSGWTDNDFWY